MAEPDDFKLDHFKVYRIKEQDERFKVALKGQFDKDFLPAKGYSLIRFLNPVSKNKEGRKDEHAHLNWYKIRTGREPYRKVAVRNQFGIQLLTLLRPEGLLAPAEKKEKGSRFPEELDHYKVYVATMKDLILRPVLLEDQFRENRNVVERAVYFAVPVEKKHDDRHFPIRNKRDHLVFYSMAHLEITERRRAEDQFGLQKIIAFEEELLGVPTEKLGWTEYTRPPHVDSLDLAG